MHQSFRDGFEKEAFFQELGGKIQKGLYTAAGAVGGRLKRDWDSAVNIGRRQSQRAGAAGKEAYMTARYGKDPAVRHRLAGDIGMPVERKIVNSGTGTGPSGTGGAFAADSATHVGNLPMGKYTGEQTWITQEQHAANEAAKAKKAEEDKGMDWKPWAIGGGIGAAGLGLGYLASQSNKPKEQGGYQYYSGGQ